MSEIIPFQPAGSPTVQARVLGVELYGALLADATADATRAARRKDVAALARFLGLGDHAAALALVVAGSAGQGNAVALGWKADQLGRKLAPATVNRRLATLRRAVKLARRLGLVDWTLDVEMLRSESYRDTVGPGLEGWRAIHAAARREAATGKPGAIRDLAIALMLHDRGLRSVEVLRLDLADVDLEGRRLAIMGKGRKERTWLTIPGPTAEAIAAWIRVRGGERGPLIVRVDPGAVGLRRLTHVSLWRSIRRLGKLAGLAVAARPHGLRHQAITRLLDVTGGDIRQVRRFSRHADLNTVAIYDDSRSDVGGRLAGLLSEDDPGPG